MILYFQCEDLSKIKQTLNLTREHHYAASFRMQLSCKKTPVFS